MQQSTSTKEFENIVNVFVLFCKEELKIKKLPTLHLLKSPKFAMKISSFGQINRSNRILIDIENRQPVDILRTVAHELVHYKQHESGIKGSGVAGSFTENQANVKAGILMRKFGAKFPKLFGLPPVK